MRVVTDRFDLVQALPDGDLLVGMPGRGYWRLSEVLADRGVGP